MAVHPCSNCSLLPGCLRELPKRVRLSCFARPLTLYPKVDPIPSPIRHPDQIFHNSKPLN